MGHFVKLYFHNILKNFLSGHIWILHSLRFPTVPKTPKTKFGWKSYAQNKIGGQNCGNFDRIAKFAICSQGCEFRNAFAKLAMVANLAMWFANLAKWFAKLAKWFANLAKWFAKLAMRIFAKLLKFYVRQMNSAMWLANFALPNSQCQQIANFAMVAN